MLKEVNLIDALLGVIEGGKVFIISRSFNFICPLEEYMEDMRFLIDEIPAAVEEPEPAAVEEKEQEPHGGREKKKRTESREQDILKAWNGGERSIKEIMEITGASYSTVRKYIPQNPEG